MSELVSLVSDWKQHPVTKYVLKEFENRSEVLVERLKLQAGQDPIQDARDSGYMLAVNDLINLEVDEV